MKSVRSSVENGICVVFDVSKFATLGAEIIFNQNVNTVHVTLEDLSEHDLRLMQSNKKLLEEFSAYKSSLVERTGELTFRMPDYCFFARHLDASRRQLDENVILLPFVKRSIVTLIEANWDFETFIDFTQHVASLHWNWTKCSPEMLVHRALLTLKTIVKLEQWSWAGAERQIRDSTFFDRWQSFAQIYVTEGRLASPAEVTRVGETWNDRTYVPGFVFREDTTSYTEEQKQESRRLLVRHLLQSMFSSDLTDEEIESMFPIDFALKFFSKRPKPQFPPILK